ncbi:MAG: O-antigen ligase family protein [Polyangiaceae bacterium]|nr:O-antigen ligase family protein [Myxococcales bacterium]MCB9586039.1 O-antigen ligase family protein [Polyangiaceae bacterium]MCB9608945.1 O-antigen ligase family protein [Polyangiaceae bacterium]
MWDPAATALAPKALAVCVLALCGAAWCAFRGAPLVLPSPLGAAGLWVAWSCFSLLWGSPGALVGLSFNIAALVLALVARATWSNKELRQQLRKLAVFLGVSTAAWALYQYAGGARGSYIHGGLGNPNWLGLSLALTLLLSIPQRSALHSLRGRLAVALSLTPQLAALYLAQSRVAWVALVVALVVGLLRVSLQRLDPTRIRAAKLGRLAPHLAWLCAMTAPLGAWGAAPSASGSWQAALAGRRFIWRSALEAMAQNPLKALTGFGSGRFSEAFLEGQGALLGELSERSAARAFQALQSAHSDWLQTFLEHGLIGWALMVAWLWLSLRAVGTGKIWIHGEMFLAALAVCAIADAPLLQPGILVLALLVTAAIGTDAFGRIPRLRRLPIWWLALGLLAVGTRLTAGHWLGERAATAAKAVPEERLSALARAVKLDPYSADTHFDFAVALLASDQPERSLEHAERSLQLSRSLGAELIRAKALSRLGRLKQAHVALLSARTISPGSFRVNLGLAAIELEQGEPGTAETSLNRAAAVLPGDSRIAPLRERIKQAKRDQELR